MPPRHGMDAENVLHVLALYCRQDGIARRDFLNSINKEWHALDHSVRTGRISPALHDEIFTTIAERWPDQVSKPQELREFESLHGYDVTNGKYLTKPRIDGAGLRKCMTCGQKFRSTHIGNRMCVSCKHTKSSLGREFTHG